MKSESGEKKSEAPDKHKTKESQKAKINPHCEMSPGTPHAVCALAIEDIAADANVKCHAPVIVSKSAKDALAWYSRGKGKKFQITLTATEKYDPGCEPQQPKPAASSSCPADPFEFTPGGAAASGFWFAGSVKESVPTNCYYQMNITPLAPARHGVMKKEKTIDPHIIVGG